MVHYRAISIFLLPIGTILGSEFWKDVDTMFNELLGPRDLSTQKTTSQIALMDGTLRDMDVIRLKRLETKKKRYAQRTVTLSALEVESFYQALIVEKTDSENVTSTDLEEKLLALEVYHEWFDLDFYDILYYATYWTKVCIFFHNKPLVRTHRHACTVSHSFGFKKKRRLNIRNRIHYLDLLCCKCHSYESSFYRPATEKDTILIHRSGVNEYFVFRHSSIINSYELIIQDFRDGIILPHPNDFN